MHILKLLLCALFPCVCAGELADIGNVRVRHLAEDGKGVGIETSCTVRRVSDGLFEIAAKAVNNADRRMRFKLVIEAETDFKPERYLIPCVMYNGNEYGSKGSPKGLVREGQPWVFSYDRSGIPSCSVTENSDRVFALFASQKNLASLRSAASLEKLPDGRFVHKIYYPVAEAPVTYSAKNKFSGRYDEWFELPSGGEVNVLAYAVSDKPSVKNYGFAEVFNRAWGLFKHEVPLSLTNREVWKYSIDFIWFLRETDENGREWIGGAYADANHAVANNIKRPGIENLTLADMEANPSLNFYFKHTGNGNGGGIGFSCQGFMCARVLIADALLDREGNAEQLAFARNVLNNWIDFRQLDNGLIMKPGQQITDCCHQGWGIIELARTAKLLRENGLDGSKYLSAAKKLAGFFVANYSGEYGFGKSWSRGGKAVDKSGSVGGFVLLGLVELWKMEKDAKLRGVIDRAMDFYYRRDIDNFVCNAGAIDCVCVDKESAYPFFESAVELYESTGEVKYLDMALKAAYYLCSWLFIYDAHYPPEAEFSKIGYHTAGGTAISAEHHAIDPYAVVMVNDFFKLAKFTGDEKWSDIGRLIWRNATQAICTPQKRIWHGLERPIGGQNEGFFQTRWTKYRTDCNMRGHLNDYLGVWLSAFRLKTLLETGVNFQF